MLTLCYAMLTPRMLLLLLLPCCRFNAFILWASIGGFVAYATSGLLFCELHKYAALAFNNACLGFTDDAEPLAAACRLMMTFLQYMFMLPTFVTMFSTYSFTQLHNISWGTKKGEVVGM